MKNFAIQYQIKGLNGYDPESFLLNSKQPIKNLMINTRQTKVKLILSCMMEKIDLKSGEVYPFRITKHNYKRESTVNLLLISDDTKQHYCWIKDISKLLSLQT